MVKIGPFYAILIKWHAQAVYIWVPHADYKVSTLNRNISHNRLILDQRGKLRLTT